MVEQRAFNPRTGVQFSYAAPKFYKGYNMSETTTLDFDDGKRKPKKGGIKSFLFTSTGKNGEAHRRNKDKKHRQHLANVVARAELYQSRGTMGAMQWHEKLKALSQGTT